MVAKPKLTKKEIKYRTKYTLNTYKDFFLSGPLFVTEKLYQATGCIEEKLTGKIEWSDWDKVKQYTPGYKKRESLREEWDTEEGVKMINSNLVGMTAFLIAGPIIAEATYQGLEKLIPQDSDVIRQITTSTATAIAGYIAGNGVTMSDLTLFRDRKNHLKEDGSIDMKKVLDTSKKYILGALKFDAVFFGGKIFMQAYLINKGMDPANASLVYDSVGIGVWYSYIIPAYVGNGTIKPKSIPEEFQQDIKRII